MAKRNIGVYWGVLALVLLTSAIAEAGTRGVLVVGTQQEVLEIVEPSGLNPEFTVSDPESFVAIRILRNRYTVYEGDSAEQIHEFIGEVEEGGMIITLHRFTELWRLLNCLPGTTTHCAKGWEVAKDILEAGACVVINGATWVVCTTAEILKCIASLFCLGKGC